jgi:hypothetical protein
MASRRVKLPHCRKFPPRISPEDLKAQTSEVMREKGANNHFQADYYERTCREVIGSTDPQFSTLQPKVRSHSEEAWAKGYEFVYSFLKKHQMDLTLSTLKVEFQKVGEPSIAGIFDRADHGRVIADLSGVAERLRGSKFDQKVHAFVAAEGLA